jgi:uncharacterized membrane protein YeaQ/YmgE (transglycosylase-associated protein family)
MSLLWAIVIGFLAGVVAKAVMPGKEPKGFILTTLLGIGGSVVATYLGQLIGIYQEGEAGGFLAAVVGAVLILWVYRLIKGKK